MPKVGDFGWRAPAQVVGGLLAERPLVACSWIDPLYVVIPGNFVPVD